MLEKYERYTPVDVLFFQKNRQNLIKLLSPNSVVILNSNDIMPTNADGVMGFVQQTDLYYLCGIDQEETVLVIKTDAENKVEEALFVRETSEKIAVWEGEKLTLNQARVLSGINNVHWLQAMPATLRRMILDSQYIYLNDNEHLRMDNPVQSRDDRFGQWCRKEFPLHTYRRLAPLMHQLRVIKRPAEITMTREAVKAGSHAFLQILKFVKPGVYEFEVEAEMSRALLQKRSRRHAFLPIIAAGASACILHYVDNNRLCNDGELLLLDYGAEYGNYNCDISRTIPVNGRFSPRQRQVYDAVLAIHDFAQSLLTPGTAFSEYNAEVREFTARKCVELGLGTKADLKDPEAWLPLANKYMPHGISHFLGLDVHDVGKMQGQMQPGMLLSCEPGIYIREEGLGIRLESDILITETGPQNLTAEIPILADEIEAIMNG